MNPVRVAHIAPLPARRPNSPVGGVGPYMFTLLDLLRDAVQNTVVCNDDADTVAITDAVPGTSFVPAWRFGDPRYPVQMVRALSCIECDLVHVQHELFLFGGGPIALLFPLLLQRLARTHRVALTVHGVVTGAEIDGSLMQGRKSVVPLPLARAAIVWIFRRIARSSAHKIVHSPELKRRLIELGAAADDVSVIEHPLAPHPGDTLPDKRAARMQLGLPAGAEIVLSWGFWSGYKGHDVLAEGFRRYRRDNKDALLLLGAGPHPQLQFQPAYAAEYADAMRGFAKIEGIDVLGYIPADKLATYVRAADVSVFAYTKYLAASGPMSFSLSLGTPVLLSSVFAETPAVLQFSAEPAALAEKLEEFFASPESYEAANEELARAASPDALRRKYVELYRALSRAGSPATRSS